MAASPKLIEEIEIAYKRAKPNKDLYIDGHGNRRFRCCNNMLHMGHDNAICCHVKWEELGKKIRELRNENQKT